MASDQTDMPELSLLEHLINSRNRHLFQFSPITLPFTNPQNNTNPDQDSPERSDPHDRIILLNPLTQSVVMIEGSAWRIHALLNDLTSSKDGPSPASKASIEAMQTVETKEGDECVICMSDYRDKVAKEMPCKHIFHGECVEKWLKINGSCPVCRYNMPVDDDNENNYKNFVGDEEGVRRREIWVSFGSNNNSGGGTRSGDDSDEVHTEMQD